MTPEATPSESFNPAYILPGTRIGTYVVHTAVGRGGGQMAYLAEGPGKGAVVLKVSLFPKGEQGSRARRMHQRFMRQIAFSLDLEGVPGVAQTFAYDMHPDRSQSGYLYMVQEWVPGAHNIVEWSRQEPHSLRLILRGWMVLAGACWGMAQKGICHRDLKAENVLMTEEGLPRIIDFNTGFRRGGPRLTSESASHAPGTHLYFSPELCEAILEERFTGKRIPFEFHPSGDLHALGAIFYEVLTGEHPFGPHLRSTELFEEIAHEVPPRPSQLNPEVPFGLEKVTLKLLEKRPKKRYQSGEEVMADLEALLSSAEDWERPFQTPRPGQHSPASSKSSGRPTPPSPAAGVPRTPTPVDLGSTAIPPPEALPSGMEPAALRLVPPLAAEGEFSGPATDAPAADSAMVAYAPPWGTSLQAPELQEPPLTIEVSPPTPAAWQRWAISLAAAALNLVLALLMVLSFLGQHGAPGSLLQKGPMVLLGKTKAAVVGAACAVLSCAELSGRVRPQDEEWFANCPPEARKTVAQLGIEDRGIAYLDDGPNVITHDAGCEVKSGPVEVDPAIPGLTGKGAVLVGHIRTGSDGASLRFTKVRLEDGRELPICVLAAGRGHRRFDGPGIPKVPDDYPGRPPSSELHAKDGFVFVATGALDLYLAR